ncbi:GtrA family protein [Trinickia diaoshuihuensis]|uniref:GtrA family protein n=1 Tax=Trinickia diaoshuihuensis TaxID=2292265 RepID=UPI0013C34084|nr:GtrA family protein [Trinickia diaoshuihuensis]
MRGGALARFVAYACVGAAGTAVQYVVLAALVATHTLDAVAASCIGAAAGAVINYALNHRFTFRSDNAHRVAAPRFFIVAAAGIALTSVLMAVFTRTFGIPWLPAQCMTTACVLALTYTINSAWAFRSVGRDV